MARFASSEDLVAASKKVRAAGYTKLDAYTPYAIEGLPDELGNRDDRVPWIVFFCGIFGAMAGFALEYYVSVIDYPLNVGGRPNLSWPSFIPVTFECGVLAASIGGVVGMLMLNGLPRPYHPVFNAPGIERSGVDKFFLCIEADDPNFSETDTRQLLQSLGAESVDEVKP
jgi:hypothetical protein